MGVESKLWSLIEPKLNQAWDWVQGQEWFGQIRSKWDEIDPDRQWVIGKLAWIGMVLGVAYVMFSLAWGTASLRIDYDLKREMLVKLQKLKTDFASTKPAVPPGDWKEFFSSQANSAGFSPEKLVVAVRKQFANEGIVKEVLYDLELRGVNIKQAVQFAFGVEHGAHPIKLRNLSFTKSKETSLLDAKFSISAFEVKE